MLGLIIEFSLVVALFVWLHRRQLRDRDRAQRVRPAQLDLDLDDESTAVHVRGYVIEELSPVASNWRSRGSLDEYLKKWNVPGIQGIDTRALTKHLRSRGAMQGCLTTEDISPEQAVAQAKAAPP